jgi:hypothetical protein
MKKPAPEPQPIFVRKSELEKVEALLARKDEALREAVEIINNWKILIEMFLKAKEDAVKFPTPEAMEELQGVTAARSRIEAFLTSQAEDPSPSGKEEGG